MAKIIKSPDTTDAGINEKYRLTMPDGSKWYMFTAEYKFECQEGGGLPEDMLRALEKQNVIWQEKTYSIDFWAQSQEEAEERIEAMKATLEYAGQLVDEVPA